MSLITADEETLKIRKGKKFGEWEVMEMVGEGGFGKVYKVRNVQDHTKLAALKAESNELEGGAAIKLEIAILKTFHKRGIRSHVPELFRSRKRKRFDYMIVTLLGENLRNLRMARPTQRLSPQTWSRMALQCLYAVKLIHDVGFIHRDIKPANFVMGHPEDPDRARVVHILDFGMAREFAKHVEGGGWKVRTARVHCDFRGTYRYCSPNVHLGREQGRVDDIYALMFMLIEIHDELPWYKERDKRKLAAIKLSTPDTVLLKNFPKEFHDAYRELSKLHYYNRPDYVLWHKCCLALMKRLKVTWSDPYDWETKDDVDKLINRRRTTPEYENAEAFFTSDPLNINEPPIKSEGTIRDSPASFNVSKITTSFHTD